MIARSAGAIPPQAIAERLDIPRSTLHDLLGDLLTTGYVRRAPSGYVLGPRLSAIAAMNPAGSQLPVRHADLEHAAERTRLPVALACLVGEDVLYLDQAGPRGPVHWHEPADRHLPRPLVSVAAGRVIVANLPYRERAALLGEQLSELTPRLNEIRRRGFDFNRVGINPALSSVAVSVGTQGSGGTISVVAFMPCVAEAQATKIVEIASLLRTAVAGAGVIGDS